MALDCTSNYTGLAIHILDGSFATNFIFTTFLLLFTIPIRVQVVTICDRLHLYKWFNVVFKKIYRTLQAAYGLYQLARECHQLHTPERQLKKTATRPRQQPMQTLPPLDEYIPALHVPKLAMHIIMITTHLKQDHSVHTHMIIYHNNLTH